MPVTEEKTKSLFRYRFGSAEFDESRFELSIAGQPVEVQRKPLEVLALLLAHAGEVVTKDELIATVWDGRPTVENVIANALTKLRDALDDDNAAYIVTQPRVGYRLKGPVERVAVGQTLMSRIQLSKGELVPLRPNFQLESLLSTSKSGEVWVARHLKTNERRVYKFATDGSRLSTLKREATLFRLLQESLGPRDDLARILDWNFETAPFFLESEFGGENMNEWAKNGSALSSLTQSQRIDLFLQIAEVVAAAHDVGVLHKDIKPANVLVAPSNSATWRLRLTDFGSGRLLDPQRIQELDITQLGLTMTTAVGNDQSGTLLYLAPELMNYQAPTIQSDVYALGMMLYQLLIGDFRKPLVSGWERDLADELLRIDIRAATEGNPAHRLHSVRALIERLRTIEIRHLHLQRERQSLAEANRVRDALRRAQVRRPWVMAACALLLVGLAASSWLYVRAIRVQHQLLQSQAQTSQQAARAEAVTQFLNNDVLGAADPFSSEATEHRTVKEALAYAVTNLEGKFASDPMTEAAIRMTLADTFGNSADLVATETQWRRAIAVLTTAGSAALPSLLQSHYGLAYTFVRQSEFEQAEKELVATDRLRLQYGIEDSQTKLMSHEGWGVYFNAQQQVAQAIPHFEQALQLLRARPSANLRTMDTLRLSLGDAYIGVNRLQEAEHLLRDLADEIKQRPNPSKLMLAGVNRMYGQSLLYQHRYQAAEPLIEQAYQATVAALGASHPLSLDALNTRCTMYSMTKQLEKSLQCVQASYELTRAARGDHHWFSLAMLAGVGQAQYALGQYAAAMRSFESARTGLVKVVGADNSTAQNADYYLARSLLQLRQIDRAALSMQRLDAKALEESEPGAPWTLRLQLLRGMVLLSQGKRDEALLLLQAAADLKDDADPTDTIVQEAQHSLRKTSSINDAPHLAGVFNEPRQGETD